MHRRHGHSRRHPDRPESAQVRRGSNGHRGVGCGSAVAIFTCNARWGARRRSHQYWHLDDVAMKFRRPNTRVQRARSLPSALRSPLMRWPLGGRCLLLLGLAGFIPVWALAENPFVEAERLSIDGQGWVTAVYASGFAHQRVTDFTRDIDRSQLFRLTKDEIDSIVKAATAARFCDLPSRIRKPENHMVSGKHTDYLDVTLRLGNGPPCKVGGGTEDLADPATPADAKRFETVWNAITAIVPEPPQ